LFPAYPQSSEGFEAVVAEKTLVSKGVLFLGEVLPDAPPVEFFLQSPELFNYMA
jgi:hypothetical protein